MIHTHTTAFIEEITPFAPPPSIDSVIDPPVVLPVVSDDLTVTTQGVTSNEPTQSELYNDSAFRMGG